MQHYKYPNPFHENRARFMGLQTRDALKEELCRQHGVRLVVVSYHVQRDEIAAYLMEQLRSYLPGTPHCDTTIDITAAACSHNVAASFPAVLSGSHMEDVDRLESTVGDTAAVAPIHGNTIDASAT